MTTFKTVTINCDWNLIGIPYVSGCPGWYETGSGSVLETLSSARGDGWVSGLARGGRVDLCPVHAHRLDGRSRSEKSDE